LSTLPPPFFFFVWAIIKQRATLDYTARTSRFAKKFASGKARAALERNIATSSVTMSIELRKSCVHKNM